MHPAPRTTPRLAIFFTASITLAGATHCGDDTSANSGPGGTSSGGNGGDAGVEAGTGGTGGSAAASGGTAGSANAAGTGGSDAGPEPFDEIGWHPSSDRDPSFFEQPDHVFRVHPSHPRLFFRSEDVDWLVARGQGPLSEAWNELAWMASSMAQEDPSGSVATNNVKGWYGDKGQAVALLGLLNQDEAYRTWAISWAKALGALDIPTDDTPLRARLQRMAVVYDWFHDIMAPEDRDELRSALIRYVEALRDWGYIQNPGYIGGHERWGYAAFAMGLIALHGEYPEADALLDQCRQHIVRGFYPAQSWIADDGGYHMGYAYSASYSDFDLPYLVWTVGTNDVVLDDWMARTCDFYLYGLQSDGTFPPAGDAFSISASAGITNCIYAQGIGNRGSARWYLENAVNPKSSPFLRLLVWDPDVVAVAPDALGADAKPLGRLFRNAGVVVARDGWDEGATHFTFKSGSFFSTNHHHRDENSFTLHYRAPLALDSGYYDQYGSDHWRNYFTRTIAHNAVVVFDSAQEMKLYGKVVSNDGGQVFRQEPKVLEDLLPGGHASLDGILRFEDRDELTYAWGDATRAYDTARVTLAQREVVFLRDIALPHPAIVVFDRVSSTDASFSKRFLLHTVDKPVVDGRLAVVSQGSGRMTSATVHPVDAALSLVGGPGNEFFVSGTNYPIDPGGAEGAPEDKGIFPGSWRIEVSPGQPALDDFFLHVLFVDDAGASPITHDHTRPIASATALGVGVADWFVVFPRASSGVSALAYAVPTDGSRRHMIAGLPPGESVSYSIEGGAVGTTVVGGGGCAVFETVASAGATVSIMVP